MEKRTAKVYMIGNTHFDPVWLWTWDEGLASVRSTLRAALDRMKEEPEFRYSFSSPAVFKMVERTSPALFSEIKQRVAEGRFCVDECMWVQPDCFSASGESYVRQCLYAQRYLWNTFGKLSDTAFQADCFGAPATLPAILRGARVKYAVYGRPDNSDLPLPLPLFRWRSPDGSEILSWRICDAAAPWNAGTEKTIADALDFCDRTGRDAAVIFGVTDHGGAPTKRAVAAIDRMREETGGRVCYSGTTGFFERQEREGTPEVGEIPIRHFGVFINCPDIKSADRFCESLLLSAETAAAFCDLHTGGAYPLARLQELNETLLFNQFHDILGGSSIEDACDDAVRALGSVRRGAEELLHLSLQRIAGELDLPPEEDTDWNIIVWNLHDRAAKRYVEAEVQWAWEFDWYEGEVCVTDADGKEYPCQKIASRECIPGFRTRFLFEAELPAFGYSTYRVHRRAGPQLSAENAPRYDNGVLSNDVVKCKLDTEHGGILRIVDAKTGKTLCGSCGVPSVWEDGSDVWAFNFRGYGEVRQFAVSSVAVKEAGPLRCTVRMELVCGKSALWYDVSLCRGENAPVVSYRIDWQETRSLFRLAFQGAGEPGSLYAAVPYGMQKRRFDGADSPAGPFVTVEDSVGGYSVLWDSVFAYAAMPDGTVYADVVRSPMFGDLHIRDIDETMRPCLSQGMLSGKLKVIPGCASGEAALRREVAQFCEPVYTIDEANHPGVRPIRGSFLRVESDSGADDVLLTVFKEAEDGSGDLIVRLRSSSEKPSSASVHIPGVGVIGPVTVAPYALTTLRVSRDGSWKETDLLEQPDGCPVT